MTSELPKRPASVSFVVILTWLVAIVTIIDGVILLFASDATLVDAGVNPDTATLTAWISIVLGLVIALFASALGNGSKFARLLISLLMMVRFVLGGFAIVMLWGSSFMWGAVVLTIIAAFVLYLLWNAKASAWFAAR
ncbi:MAG: hypothetical protein V9E82_05210 [Candidatus Nanopelagicales bacterium]